MKPRHDQSDDRLPMPGLNPTEVPPGMDRRAFMMRSAVVGAAAVISGCSTSKEQQAAEIAATPAPQPAPQAAPPLSPDLDVVKKAKGPVMTVLDEFYKVGPGPSSSHTIGPMRITYDFYQRATGDELEIQGDVRRRPGGIGDALLSATRNLRSGVSM
jgi:L-serine dehydratase